MTELLLAAKFACLLLGGSYAVPVLIGGAIHGNPISGYQTWFFTCGWTGFVALQWLL